MAIKHYKQTQNITTKDSEWKLYWNHSQPTSDNKKYRYKDILTKPRFDFGDDNE